MVCMLELRGVSKSYAGRVVLHSTDLTPQSGCTTVLLGPSALVYNPKA